MKHSLEKLTELTKNVALTPEDKLDMFQNIRAYANANPVRTPSLFMKYSLVYASLCAALVGTGATSIAAEGSLPGDTLYSVKTNVNENVLKSLSFSEASKARVSVRLMDKRMSELEEMIVLKIDSPEKVDVIVGKLEEHKEDLRDFTEQVEGSDAEKAQEASEIYLALETVIDTHMDILREITQEEDPQVAIANTQDQSPDAAMDAASSADPMMATMMVAPADTVRAKMAPVPEATSSIPVPEIIEDESVITEIQNFSLQIDPLIINAKSKARIADDASVKIQSDVRKRILDTAEDELKINIDTQAETN